MHRVCVLLATYNGAKYVIQQIESILCQHGVSVDIYVSDDFSTDGTYELLKKISKDECRINVLDREKPFGNAGKNFFSLIERVSLNAYDYVAFSDQDDLWYPNKLETSIKYSIDKGCSGVSSCVTAFWADGRKCYIDKAGDQKQFDYMFESAGPGCTFLMKLDLITSFKHRFLERNHDFNCVYYHDWSVYAFARSNGFEWYIIPESTMDYRQHSNNETGVNRGLRAAFVRAKKIFDGWYFKQVIFIGRAVGYEMRLNSLLFERKPFFIYQLRNIQQFRRQPLLSIVLFVYLSIVTI